MILSRRPPRTLLTVALWATVTVTVTLGVWRATADLGGGQRARVLNAGEIATQLALAASPGVSAPAGPSSPGGPAAGTPQPSARPRPATTAPPTPAPRGQAGARPRVTGTPSPTPAPTRRASPRPTAPSPAPGPFAPASVSQSWHLRGGDVLARCTGSAIQLVYATPADGWTVRVEEAGPSAVHVHFRSADGEDELAAVCSSGRPVRTSEDDGGAGTDPATDD